MVQIALRIRDEQKANVLVEMLSAMNFVEILDVSEVNGGIHKSVKDTEPMPYIGPEYLQMQREEDAYTAMKPALLTKYARKFVALFQGQLVDLDENELLLLDRINQKFPEKIVLIRQVLEQTEPPLMFRSPRLVKEKL